MKRLVHALAQVYAKSVYELAEDAGGREKIVEVGQEIEQLCELARSDKAFGQFLASPIINKGERSRSPCSYWDSAAFACSRASSADSISSRILRSRSSSALMIFGHTLM